jgi:hypothetical protein
MFRPILDLTDIVQLSLISVVDYTYKVTLGFITENQ